MCLRLHGATGAYTRSTIDSYFGTKRYSHRDRAGKNILVSSRGRWPWTDGPKIKNLLYRGCIILTSILDTIHVGIDTVLRLHRYCYAFASTLYSVCIDIVLHLYQCVAFASIMYRVSINTVSFLHRNSITFVLQSHHCDFSLITRCKMFPRVNVLYTFDLAKFPGLV